MSETAWRERLPEERIESEVADLKPAYTEAQARAEARRCLYCYDAPCIAACPTGIDIPEFIRKIGSGNPRGAARTILDANILGLSCAVVCPVEVLCAGACVINKMGAEPIQIGKLQRTATEWAYARGVRFFDKGAPTGKRVALVGGGPASLACAHELTRLGHEAIVLERNVLPGGLNTTGVAPYKMRSEASLREVAYVAGIGFAIRTGVNVGEEPSVADLLREHDAMFLGIGLGPDSRMGVPGDERPGVLGACAFIERLKNAPARDVRGALDGVERALVVGGGNTAIDAVRNLKRAGVPEVKLVYRRSEREMPAYHHEVAHARKEGIEILFQLQPTAVLGEDRGAILGPVTALRCVGMELGPPDESGRARPVPVSGSERDLSCDLVLVATGQEKLEALLRGVPGVKLAKGRVEVDPKTGQTGNPRVFAGGDCVNGGKEVVNAAAEGKLAARGIDAMLVKGR